MIDWLRRSPLLTVHARLAMGRSTVLAGLVPAIHRRRRNDESDIAPPMVGLQDQGLRGALFPVFDAINAWIAGTRQAKTLSDPEVPTLNSPDQQRPP
jgi:hypothetical protein